MTRHAGPLLVLLAIAGMFGARWAEGRRAGTLLEGEARARTTLAALADACRSALARGGPLASLDGGLAADVPGLAALPGAGSEQVGYAHDEVYVYGWASRPHRDEASGAVAPGFVLRAWPLRFGVTGDLEYHLGDDGQLWAGQNRTGRSGTTQGFPPPFPEPGIELEDAAWWRLAEVPHR